MSTLSDLTVEIERKLRSYTGSHEVSTYLTADAGEDDLAFSVADGDRVEQGIVQIDNELVYVDSASEGSLVIPPYGRGYLGSLAAEHTADTQVVVDPTFPRVDIQTAVREALRGVYPSLFRVRTTSFTYSPSTYTYELPTDADRVLQVSYDAVGSTGQWPTLSRWDFDQSADTSTYASGRTITLGQSPDSGRTVLVTYAAPFGNFPDDDSDITQTGLDTSAQDVIVLGACWRLIQYLEPSRLQTGSVENQERAQYSPVGAASQLTRQLLALYERRLEEERSKLVLRFPTRPRFGR